MFEQLRQNLRDALSRASSPTEGRAVLAQMKQTLVDARVAVTDLHEAVEKTRLRVRAERQEMETAQRRAKLAADVNDAETARIAEEYAHKHGERVAVFERKLQAQEGELALLEREVEEMTAQFKAAAAGVGAGTAAPTMAPPPEELDLDADLKQNINRAARESQADAMLAELKRRMGK